MKFNSFQQEQYANQISTEQLIDISELLLMWYGIEHLQFGDRKPCDAIVKHILNLSPNSNLRNWGKAPAYPKIPKRDSYRINVKTCKIAF